MDSTDTSYELHVTLPSDLEYVLTRDFDAPRALVFDALTKPEHIAHWYGPRGHTLAECEVDLRVGGEYRFVDCAADGSEHPFKGVYREIAAPKRLVYTWTYDVAPFNEHAAVISVVLDEYGGRTTMTCVTTCDSREVRDSIINSGMEGGARESYERLAEHLQTMR